MAEHSYTSRREMDQFVFHPAVSLLVPVAAVLLQAALPHAWSRLIILDLPLIVTIYFALSRRSPILGAVTGTLIGLFQDALTGRPLGINGISKAIIGYAAASIGFAIDADNLLNRLGFTFFFSLVQSGIIFLISRFLLADRSVMLAPVHELIRAALNAALALPVFAMLDRFRHRD